MLCCRVHLFQTWPCKRPTSHLTLHTWLTHTSFHTSLAYPCLKPDSCLLHLPTYLPTYLTPSHLPAPHLLSTFIKPSGTCVHITAFTPSSNLLHTCCLTPPCNTMYFLHHTSVSHSSRTHSSPRSHPLITALRHISHLTFQSHNRSITKHTHTYTSLLLRTCSLIYCNVRHTFPLTPLHDPAHLHHRSTTTLS